MDGAPRFTPIWWCSNFWLLFHLNLKPVALSFPAAAAAAVPAVGRARYMRAFCFPPVFGRTQKFIQTLTYCLSAYLCYHMWEKNGRPLKMFGMRSYLD